MKYIVKAPGFAPEVIEAEGISLADMQHHVEGTITLAPAPKLEEAGIDMFANDDGLMLRLSPNLGYLAWGHPQVIVGPVLLAACDEEGETIGLSEEQIEVGLAFLTEAGERVGEFLIRAVMGV
jgi:hypothetical protein